MRQVLQRPVVECQRYLLPREETDTGEHWFDRMVFEGNFVRTWRGFLDDWCPRITKTPPRVYPTTARPDDTSPYCRAFREAMVNLLLHQDYAHHACKAVVRHYADQDGFLEPRRCISVGCGLA